MKILIYRWNAWNQADIEETLALLGHECIPLCKKPNHIEEDPPFVDALSEQLKRERPDLLFSVNFFPVLADACHLAGCPYACWNCDGSLLAMYHESVFHDTNFIFTFDKGCVSLFRHMGVSHIWHMPLGVNDRRIRSYFAKKPTHTDITKISPDISFVGSLYTKNAFDEIAGRLPDYLAGYLDGVLAAQQLISGGSLLNAMLTPDICEQLEEITEYHRSERSFAGMKELFSTTVLGFGAAHQKRAELLQSLARAAECWEPRAAVHLYTADPDASLPRVQVHPPADYFSQAPQIFHESTINIHSTIPTIYTGIPLRIWDILGCGGFLMTDYREELTDFFDMDKHLACYEDTEELLARAEFYHKHQEQARRIATEAQELVLREHTLTNRLSDLLKILN